MNGSFTHPPSPSLANITTGELIQVLSAYPHKRLYVESETIFNGAVYRSVSMGVYVKQSHDDIVLMNTPRYE